MAIVSSREVLGRSLRHRIGESPNAQRRFIVTLDDPSTATQLVIAAVGISHGDAHPEYPYLICTDASVSDNAGTPYHAEVSVTYEQVQQDFDQNPLLRPDVWSFGVGGASVPAIRYYEADESVAPLTNAAGDFFEGATTEESEVRATVSGNRPTFPLALAAYVTNAVNNAPYLGGAQYTWKCTGISGQQASEVVNGLEVRYYQITSELVYRASGWPLILPDVGFNYIEDREKKRAWVMFRDEDGQEQRIPAANAVALADDGRMLPPGQPPRLLSRRVHRAVNFSTYFGSPTF